MKSIDLNKVFFPSVCSYHFYFNFRYLREEKDGEIPGEGEKAQLSLWARLCVCSSSCGEWQITASQGFGYHRQNSFWGQTTSLVCLGSAAGREWGQQGPGLVPQAQLWGERGRREKVVPETLPKFPLNFNANSSARAARWHLLKLFHLHPGSKGCSEAVCRQVSHPSVLRDFTALQFCSGVSWELQGSCISFSVGKGKSEHRHEAHSCLQKPLSFFSTALLLPPALLKLSHQPSLRELQHCLISPSVLCSHWWNQRGLSLFICSAKFIWRWICCCWFFTKT